MQGLPVTVVMALHDLNQAIGCDRLGLMVEGRLVACGLPEGVLTSDHITRTFCVGARAPCAIPSMGQRFSVFIVSRSKEWLSAAVVMLLLAVTRLQAVLLACAEPVGSPAGALARSTE